MATLGATKGSYLLPAGEAYPLSEQVEAVGLASILQALHALQTA